MSGKKTKQSIENELKDEKVKNQKLTEKNIVLLQTTKALVNTLSLQREKVSGSYDLIKFIRSYIEDDANANETSNTISNLDNVK